MPPLSVLIVEDFADAADSLAELLALHGHESRTAGSVAGALAALSERAFDAVVLDVNLPDGDGYEVARRVRERPGPRPLLVVATGCPNMEGWSRLEGVDHHLFKPADPVWLADLLAEHADRSARSGSGG